MNSYEFFLSLVEKNKICKFLILSDLIIFCSSLQQPIPCLIFSCRIYDNLPEFSGRKLKLTCLPIQ